MENSRFEYPLKNLPRFELEKRLRLQKLISTCWEEKKNKVDRWLLVQLIHRHFKSIEWASSQTPSLEARLSDDLHAKLTPILARYSGNPLCFTS